MSRIDKLNKKLYEKPVRNDITFNEVAVLAKAHGCEIDTGGRHQFRVVHKETGTIIPIPQHGDTVGEAYIRQLKILFDRVKSLKEVE